MTQSRKESNSLEIKPKTVNVLPDKGFKITGIKMLNELMKMVHKENKNSNKDIESIQKFLQLKNAITKLKTSLKEVHPSLIKQNKE